LTLLEYKEILQICLSKDWCINKNWIRLEELD